MSSSAEREYLTYIFLVAVLVAAVAPLLNVVLGYPFAWLTTPVAAGINLFGWSVVITLLFARHDLKRRFSRLARTYAINPREKHLESLVDEVVHEMERKDSALALNLVERKITSKEELSRTLERIVALSYNLLEAESAELALFDKDAGLYHSSFVLGKPFRVSAQAMLAGAAEEREEALASPDVLVQPISFAGTILGSLRVGLKKDRVPSSGDQEIMRLLALQGGLALLNAQYTEQLLRMKRAGEESVKAKTGFLANLSHEIRGPLGIMLNAVELVVDGLCGAVTPDQLETLRMVRGNGEHLLELINDVLDYAKIEAGRIKPDTSEILVNDLLQDITQVVRSQAESKGHTISFVASKEALAIRCDRRHARQMMINLLTNAIKYTPDGGKVEVWAERGPRGKVKLNVRDSGVGIAESERGKVFAPFERVEDAYSIKQVGAGLGMSLTKRLAEMNGGTIDFISSIGKGSQFWLLFPSVEYDVTAKSESSAEFVAPAQGNGNVILLVQASNDEREMLQKYLTSVGFKVLGVPSFAEGKPLLERDELHLVLIDNDVLDVADESVIKVLQERAQVRHLPVILMSTRAFTFDIEQYLRAGVDRCVTKPIELRVVAQTCRELIDSSAAMSTRGEGSSSGGAPRILARKVLRVDDILH